MRLNENTVPREQRIVLVFDMSTLVNIWDAVINWHSFSFNFKIYEMICLCLFMTICLCSPLRRNAKLYERLALSAVSRMVLFSNREREMTRSGSCSISYIVMCTARPQPPRMRCWSQEFLTAYPIRVQPLSGASSIKNICIYISIVLWIRWRTLHAAKWPGTWR